jgi:hypothetical protein
MNHFNIFTYVTLASSNSALPDNGDYTETRWSCFNVNFNANLILFLGLSNCASVDEETLIMFHWVFDCVEEICVWTEKYLYFFFFQSSGAYFS